MMFIPDPLISCMIEVDVSSYLQTPSLGQVPHHFFSVFFSVSNSNSVS